MDFIVVIQYLPLLHTFVQNICVMLSFDVTCIQGQRKGL